MDLARHLSDWRLEPVSRRLERFAFEARRSAERLGRKVEVVVESSGSRLDAVQWAPFWGAFGPASSSTELAESLFLDGLSTRTETGEYSGRGVGLGAVRAACCALGGTAHIESK